MDKEEKEQIVDFFNSVGIYHLLTSEKIDGVDYEVITLDPERSDVELIFDLETGKYLRMRQWK